MRRMGTGIAGLAGLLLSGGVLAQEHSDRDPVWQQQLETMQRELELLRRDNQTMRDEIDELRAKTDENWLTEARATEIRGLVEDVLADADTRASLLSDGLMAGWSEHFFLASIDGRFKLVLEGQMQIRFVLNRKEPVSFPSSSANFTDQYRYGFENTRTRLTFRGHVFNPDLEYYVMTDFRREVGGFAQLLDAWVRYNLNDNWSVRVGQFKLPFNREELVSSSRQLAVERSLVNETLNLGRSQGAELIFHDDVSRWSVAISDGASAGISGLLTTTRSNTTALTQDTEYAFSSRYERLLAGSWDQFVDFTSPRGEEFGLLFGIGGHVEQGESTGALTGFGARDETRLAGYSADLSAEWGGATAFLSFTHLYVDIDQGAFVLDANEHLFGVVAQAGMYVSPKWEVFIRGEYAWVEGDLKALDLRLVTVGCNYYLEGHDVKWTTDLGMAVSEVDQAYASDLAGYRRDLIGEQWQIVFRTQIQLLF